MTSRRLGIAPGSRPSLSIVLATIDEGENLPLILGQLESAPLPGYEVIVVDDGSVDGTVPFLEAWVGSHPNTRAILNDRRQSLLRAHHQALQDATGRFTVFMDADLQHPVDGIAPILALLEQGADLAVGTRYADGGSTGDRRVVRGLESRVAAGLTRAILPQTRRLSDPLSGFFGIRTDIFSDLPTPHPGVKLLLYLLSSNRAERIAELPYDFAERRSGHSKTVDGGAFVFRFLDELWGDFRFARVLRLPRNPTTVSRTSTNHGVMNPDNLQR